ncbi:hypothetical protein [Nitrosomonas sp.]|uniref:hypothetical protein n=1 Tax=Nitrosomonas sp. TaxID=42353 RepID=UPI0025E5E2D4|nr:hypothetical protein [Nitrosomonas sp.]MCC6916627.1 hypothetical protein [Nitrosomonas sp.]
MIRRKAVRFNIVLPVLLAAILFVPFVMNFLGHAWFGQKHFPPLTMMKLPANSSIISLPQEVRQYSPFEIRLRLNTKELAQRINDIVKKSLPGTEPQGIYGEVFPEMRAGIAGDDVFSIDPPEPQIQLVDSRGETDWSWIVTPEKTGRYKLLLKLYLQTSETVREQPQAVDLAVIQLFVQKNPDAWIRTYGIGYAALILLVAGWWWKKRLAKKQE